MDLEGIVRNGVIVLHTPGQLAEGTRVRVQVDEPDRPPTLANLLKYAGAIAGMPEDFADQHDHYIPGTPKR